MKKTTTGTTNVTVVPYLDNNTINYSVNAISTLSGIGWFNIPINNILSYEDTIFNYSRVRFWSDTSHYFSEVYLRKEGNDTINPTIFDWEQNTTTLDCAETVRYSTNVTDDIEVNNVTFTIEGINYSAVQNNGLWEYDMTLALNETKLYDFTNIFAYDLAGNMNSTSPNLQVNYSCIYEEYINITHIGQNGTDQINLTDDSIIITWTTKSNADSKVEYGLESGNLNQTVSDSTKTKNHLLTLTGLLENTTYYFVILAFDEANNTGNGWTYRSRENHLDQGPHRY